MRFVIVVECDSKLFEMIDALGTPRRLAYALDGGQQERDQYADDRDDYQQFDQGHPRGGYSFFGHRTSATWDVVHRPLT